MECCKCCWKELEDGLVQVTFIGWPSDFNRDVRDETDIDPADWPDRQILCHVESEKKKLQRFKSAESFAGLSPPPREENVNLDVDDILKCFRTDGTAACDDLSPLKQLKPSKKLSSITPTKVPWPNVYDLLYHDVYYNKSDACDKNDHHLTRLRARYVSHETSSTCSAVVGKSVPSVKQLKQVKKEKVNVQRISPRSRSSRVMSDSQVTSTRQMKRKAEPMPAPPPKRKSSTNKVDIKPVSKEETKDTGTASESQTARGRTESRSERHKRQLQSIVDKTLESKGIGKSHEAYPTCSKRLYDHSKLMVKDLPNSYNLKQEMTNIANNLVDQVVEIQLQRLSAVRRKKSA